MAKKLSYLGSSYGYTYSPDPRGFVEAKFNVDAYTGQDDISSGLLQHGLVFQSGICSIVLQFDDFAVQALSTPTM